MTDQDLHVLLDTHRVRLIRHCRWLSGQPELAEDIAQETLLEAWRRRDQLYDPAGIWPWLATIASNVVRRSWRREARWQRQPSRSLPAGIDDDLETALDQRELAMLLDRALPLLPDTTRALLIAAYINEVPQTELASRCGLSPGALAMRLQRGKRALHQILLDRFPDDALAFGLVSADDLGWQETRIWCRECGGRKLEGRFDREQGLFTLRCQACCQEPSAIVMHSDHKPIFTGVSGYKAALTRYMNWTFPRYLAGIETGHVPCRQCGRSARLRRGIPASAPPLAGGSDGWYEACPHCGNTADCISLAALALYLPRGQRFWREHPRIRREPIQEINVDGQATLLVRYQSLTAREHYDVLFNRESGRLHTSSTARSA